MSEYTRMHDRFQYHLEDVNCVDCLYFKENRIERHANGNGCGEEHCRFEDIRQDAIKNGRIKRKRGHFKCRE